MGGCAFRTGHLTASVIASLKLDADWVILSECNTAAGSQRKDVMDPLRPRQSSRWYGKFSEMSNLASEKGLGPYVWLSRALVFQDSCF